jgi:hypothetical protein
LCAAAFASFPRAVPRIFAERASNDAVFLWRSLVTSGFVGPPGRLWLSFAKGFVASPPFDLRFFWAWERISEKSPAMPRAFLAPALLKRADAGLDSLGSWVAVAGAVFVDWASIDVGALLCLDRSQAEPAREPSLANIRQGVPAKLRLF